MTRRDDETLDPRERTRQERGLDDPVVAFELAFHPELGRIGSRFVAGSAADPALAQGVVVGRDAPLWDDPSGQPAPLSDPCISRAQIRVRWVGALSLFAIEVPDGAKRTVQVFGARGQPLGSAPADAPPGSFVAIGDRAVVRLTVEPRGTEPTGAGLLGSSALMHRLRGKCRALAALSEAVLITGPTGAGKERAARAIHQLERRAAGPFLAVNCAALPEALAESELFGHVRGAFSGAAEARPGVFEAANGGSVLLDEVGELTPALQAKLLRVLQERAVRPVGATRERPVDVRVLAATHRDLARDVAAGRFRQDLYSRLSSLVLDVPPLELHREDVPVLFTSALRRLTERADHAALSELFRPADDRPPPLPMALYLSLLGTPYPGNVRDLESLAARVAAAVLRGDPPELAIEAEVATVEAGASRPSADELRAALRDHDHVLSRVATALGVSHSTVDRWMRELGLPRARDLETSRVREALARARGDVAAAAAELSVSERALVLRMRDLGVTAGG
ncbi:MAG: sigma 54-interacting transcriptional regulator [Polyangiaceae bacterium]|nr:sigma 54-interacting transcriptional regulator [Polyangiaceae bacterium]